MQPTNDTTTVLLQHITKQHQVKSQYLLGYIIDPIATLPVVDDKVTYTTKRLIAHYLINLPTKRKRTARATMLDVWEESTESFYLEEDSDHFLEEHACLSHDDLVASGQPTRPLEFPTPIVYDAVMADLTAADHRTGVEYDLKNVLRRENDPDRAYLMKKKLAKSTYGYVKLCVVLRRVNAEERDSTEAKSVQWQSTGEFVAIKCSSWAKIQSMRGRHLVDPIKEISVLQLIGNGSNNGEHVMGCLEVLQDEQYLYTVMPHYPGGDLYGKFDMSGLQLYPDEEEAREYFKQLLSVSWWCYATLYMY